MHDIIQVKQIYAACCKNKAQAYYSIFIVFLLFTRVVSLKGTQTAWYFFPSEVLIHIQGLTQEVPCVLLNSKANEVKLKRVQTYI